jgi:hypothetical protein
LNEIYLRKEDPHGRNLIVNNDNGNKIQKLQSQSDNPSTGGNKQRWKIHQYGWKTGLKFPAFSPCNQRDQWPLMREVDHWTLLIKEIERLDPWIFCDFVQKRKLLLPGNT